MDPKTITREQALHLFAKQASAEGIDLNRDDITDEQFEAGFNDFVENTMPAMLANGGNPVLEEGAEDQTPALKAAALKDVPKTAGTKIAENAHALFQAAFLQQAAAEGLDLSQYPEEKVAEAYNQFIEDGIPALLRQNEEAQKVASQRKQAEAAVREVTMMGEHFGETARDLILKGLAEKLSSAGVISKEAADAMCAPTPAAPADDKKAPPFVKRDEKKDEKKASASDRIEAIAAQRALGSKEASGAESREAAIAARTEQLLALYGN